jgi:threonyl-tRNA synthetase
MNIGDFVGGIYKREKDGKEFWVLIEDKINKIAITKKCGRRYYTKSKFRPLDADDVDSNTKEMEEAVNKGYIITREVFGLNDITRPFAENWVKWANENMDKAVSVLQSEVE